MFGKQGRARESSYTRLVYFIIIIAIVVEMYLGFTYINSDIPADATFGYITMIEAVMGLIGFLVMDLLRTGKFEVYPSRFKESTDTLYIKVGITILLLEAVQIVAGMFLTVRDYEKAAAIIFAAPMEEVFFRGFIMTIFIIASKNLPKKYKLSFKVGKEKKDLSFIDVTGILFSSILFMMLHVNYYGNYVFLIGALVSGIVLGTVYWIWEDLEVCIYAHLFVNVTIVFQCYAIGVLTF